MTIKAQVNPDLRGFTVVELIEAATLQAQLLRDGADAQVNGAAREFAIAITALEDAQMRFTRGVAKLTDRFAPKDLQK